MGMPCLLVHELCTTSPSLKLQVFVSGVRYTMMENAPINHPFPTGQRPLWGSLRRTRAGKAFDLLISEQRRVNIAPNPPIQRGLSYWRGVTLQIIRLIFSYILADALSYPITHFAPSSYGGTEIGQFPPFVECVKDLAPRLGLDWGLLWLGFAFSYMIGIINGLEATFNLTAAVTIGLGYNLESEWPRISDWWWIKPSSLNEFWGRRYHRVSSCSARSRRWTRG